MSKELMEGIMNPVVVTAAAVTTHKSGIRSGLEFSDQTTAAFQTEVRSGIPVNLAMIIVGLGNMGMAFTMLDKPFILLTMLLCGGFSLFAGIRMYTYKNLLTVVNHRMLYAVCANQRMFDRMSQKYEEQFSKNNPDMDSGAKDKHMEELVNSCIAETTKEIAAHRKEKHESNESD